MLYIVRQEWACIVHLVLFLSLFRLPQVDMSAKKKERTKVRENAINRLFEIKQPGDYTIRTIQIAYHNALAFHAKRLRERVEEII